MPDTRCQQSEQAEYFPRQAMQLLEAPRSIAIIGGSNTLSKPGGRLTWNLKQSSYTGKLFIVNRRGGNIQGMASYKGIYDIPENVDLAIITIPARFVYASVKELIEQKKTRAFIVMSAGFGEFNEDGKREEIHLARLIKDNNAVLVGPNCMGVLTSTYNGLFGGSLPTLKKGCIDFVSCSGSVSYFVLELGIPRGMGISSLYTLGNSALTGVEDIIRFWDETYQPGKSSPVKMVYIEAFNKPELFLKHAMSLTAKGCHIVAIKAGTTEVGGAAAASHTGAMLTDDQAVDALFQKANVIRAHSKSEFVDIALALSMPQLQGNRTVIVTHAGGPGVMLADTLFENGFSLPEISAPLQQKLAEICNPGSALHNPIDFLATGTYQQLDQILSLLQEEEDIDSISVIFGTPGLWEIYDDLTIILKHFKQSKIPIYPLLLSPFCAKEPMEKFVSEGGCYFSDEVLLAHSLGKVRKVLLSHILPSYPNENNDLIPEEKSRLLPNTLQNRSTRDLSYGQIKNILDLCGFSRPQEILCTAPGSAVDFWKDQGNPVVMKATGVHHKSDLGGVLLGVAGESHIVDAFQRLMALPGASGVLIQQQITGIEMFAGVKYEPGFGHLISVGSGGIFVEIMKDLKCRLAPLSSTEAEDMIKKLKCYPILEGIRGESGINISMLRDMLLKLSGLVKILPWISEMDLNPLICTATNIYCVDSRIFLLE